VYIVLDRNSARGAIFAGVEPTIETILAPIDSALRRRDLLQPQLPVEMVMLLLASLEGRH